MAGSRRPRRLPGSRAADAAAREGWAAWDPQLIPAARTGTGGSQLGGRVRGQGPGSRRAAAAARASARLGLLAGQSGVSRRPARASRFFAAVSDPFSHFPPSPPSGGEPSP